MLHRGLTLGLLAIAVTLIAPAPSSAELPFPLSIVPFSAPEQGRYQHGISIGSFFRKLFGRDSHRSRRRPASGSNDAPELDVSGAGSAATLVVGGSLVLMDRRRRARKRSDLSG
jgi:hypothetical protein